jgi:Asp-tRNA(Asn)/Glu-tRNA(Gln) amidotransferase A subunit family amidase
LTCRQLVQTYLDRIEAYDRKVRRSMRSLWSTPNALASADALDARLAHRRGTTRRV